MKRFIGCQKKDESQTLIVDVQNTEPVCLIFSKYHPYAVDLILVALNQKYPEIEKT